MSATRIAPTAMFRASPESVLHMLGTYWDVPRDCKPAHEGLLQYGTRRSVRWKEMAEAVQNVRKSLKNGGRAM